MIKGTPGHNTPEVLRGPRRDRRADLYFLGVVLYEVLTKKRPFPCKKTGRFIEAHLHHEASVLSSLNPRIPDPFNRVTLRPLEKEPSQRFQSASEEMESLTPRNTGYSYRYLKHKLILFPQDQFTGKRRELDLPLFVSHKI